MTTEKSRLILAVAALLMTFVYVFYLMWARDFGPYGGVAAAAFFLAVLGGCVAYAYANRQRYRTMTPEELYESQFGWLVKPLQNLRWPGSNYGLPPEPSDDPNHKPAGPPAGEDQGR